MSTVRADNFGKRDGSASISGDGLVQGPAKSWVNMNGTGTIAIRDSFNVSSLTDNAIGDYTATVAAAFPSVNYCITGSASATASVLGLTPGDLAFSRTTTQFRFYSLTSAGGNVDAANVNAITHGDPA